MKPVKIAMMGMTHGHTRKYYQTLIENKKLDWVASCAQDEEAKKVYELYKTGVPCYLDPEEMYKKHPDIEAVVIASANDRHFEQMKWCAEKGIHILSMKIPSFDMKEYDEMIALCDKAGIVCQIELEMHYNSVVRRLEKLVKEGAVGKIKAVQMTNITLSPVWAFPWQGDPKASFGSVVPLKKGDPRFRGGALCDHPHIFDLIRHLTGSDFDYIYAEVAPNLRDGLKVEDMLMAVGKMKDGTAFLFDPSWSRLEESDVAERRLALPLVRRAHAAAAGVRARRLRRVGGPDRRVRGLHPQPQDAAHQPEVAQADDPGHARLLRVHPDRQDRARRINVVE